MELQNPIELKVEMTVDENHNAYPGAARKEAFRLPSGFPPSYLPFELGDPRLQDDHFMMWVKYGDHTNCSWPYVCGPPSHIKPPPPRDYPPNPMMGDVKSAEVALTYYNKNHQTDYELVEAVGRCNWFSSSVWVHVSFKAKPKNADDSSAKLFFAEYETPICPIFHYCGILEGVETVTGCEKCGDHFVHPASGLQNGGAPQNPMELKVETTEDEDHNAYPGAARKEAFRLPSGFPPSYLPFELGDPRLQDNHFMMWVKYGDHTNCSWPYVCGPPSHIKPPPPRDYPPNPMMGDVKSAEVALTYYNKNHQTDYELVEAVGRCNWFSSSVWVHVSFKAKPKNADDSSAKLFFAEYETPICPIFHYCGILEGVETITGCKQCGDHFVHPAFGLQSDGPPSGGSRFT